MVNIMQKIKVLYITDNNDSEYPDLLMNYLNVSEYRNRLSIEQVDAKLINSEMDSLDYIAVLTEVDPTLLELNNKDNVLYLTESASVESNSIFKYQPLDQIFKAILNLYYDDKGKLLSTNDRKSTSIISFTSANGGTGKTVLSLNFAKFLASHSLKVLYLSLERLTSYNSYLVGEKEKSSELYYYLKDDPLRLFNKLPQLIDTDKELKIDFIPTNLELDEIKSLTKLHLEELLKTIVDLNEYDFLIIDMDSENNMLREEIMSRSHEVFWILNPDETSFMKTHFLIDTEEYKKIVEKKMVHFIINNYGGSIFSNKSNFELSPKVYINHQSSWQNINDREKLLGDSKIGIKLLKCLPKISIGLEEDEHEGRV